jgi:hypothetical protein
MIAQRWQSFIALYKKKVKIEKKVEKKVSRSGISIEKANANGK